MKIDLRYWGALAAAMGPGALVRAAARRVGRSGRWRAPRPATSAERTAAAAALGAARPIFAADGATARALYRLLLPGAAARARDRAQAILGHRIELFGQTAHRGGQLDWHLDPVSGRRFDPTVPAGEIDLGRPGVDARGVWEMARGAHLVELGVAARLHPELAPAARAEVVAEIGAFLDENPLGRGIHWASPLEAAIRVSHWLAALELTGALGAASWAWKRRLGGALVEHGQLIRANLEEGGVVTGNHLLGDLLGLIAVGVALDGAAGSARPRDEAARRFARELERQLTDDGAGFEGSIAYHRFALEMAIAAERFAEAGGIDLGVSGALRRMMAFVRGYLGPGGREPGFGDGDEGRVLPLAPREPRDHGYLLAVGAARLADAGLKPAGARFSEEAVWLTGAAGYRRWRALPEFEGARVASFPTGGVHFLRTGPDYVAVRCGGHGQRGVGGHSHGDQLSLVVTLDGEELLVDPGTFAYASDPVWRDRFRGTGAHSTVVLDGEEQSPPFDGRPFALPDRARARTLAVGGQGGRWHVVGEHGAWAPRALHRREVMYDERLRAVRVTDRVTGRGEAAVEVRFQLGELEAVPLDDAGLRRWLEGLRGDWAEELDGARAFGLGRGGRIRAVLAPSRWTPGGRIERGWWAPRWGERRPSTVARFGGRGHLPMMMTVALVLAPAGV